MKQIDDLVAGIKEKTPRRILLQLPDGLKTKAADIVDAIESNGTEVVLSGDSCYGACDLRIDEAARARCDLIVHVGHSKFYRHIPSKIPVIHHEWKIDIKLDENKIRSEFKKITEDMVGVLTTVQYMDYIHTFSAILRSVGKKPIVGGQVLGCWTKNADRIKHADCFLFFGTGDFHPLGLSKFNKKIYFYDLERSELRSLQKEASLTEKRRIARIEKAKDCNSFAILVSSKPGQSDFARAERMKKSLEKRDKKAFIVIMDEISDEKLLGLKVDCFINTACPRLAEDKFSKLMINADDFNDIL